MTVDMTVDPKRNTKLQNAFIAFGQGTKKISTTRDAELFLEAARVHASPSERIQMLLSTSQRRDALTTAIRISNSAEFLCHHLLPFLDYMSDEKVKLLYEGQLLHQLLSTITEGFLTWESLKKLYLGGGMPDPARNVKTFAWLCVEAASNPKPSSTVIEGINEVQKGKPFQENDDIQVRKFGYQLDKLIGAHLAGIPTAPAQATPGGRHDNDKENYRDIAIFPTADEFHSSEHPFLRLASEVAATVPEHKLVVHLDNLFRLLREDMLQELKNDTKVALGLVKSKRLVQRLERLQFWSIFTGSERRGRSCALEVTFAGPKWPQYNEARRRAFLKEHPNILKHQSFGAICSNTSIISFGSIVRDEDKLVQNPPKLVIEFISLQDIVRTLEIMQTSMELFFVVVDTPIFAYRPVLERLKDIRVLPLESHLLRIPAPEGEEGFSPQFGMKLVVQKMSSIVQQGKCISVKPYDKKYTLDIAQAKALITALDQAVAIVQGPPGTGKSYIGALVAALLMRHTKTRILILAYTNHALDQFLEACMSMGIHKSYMTRLGSKSSTQTNDIQFETQFRENRHRFRLATFVELKVEAKHISKCIEDLSETLFTRARPADVLDHLQLCDECPEASGFWDAFQIPALEHGFSSVNKQGKAYRKDSLLVSWLNNVKKPRNSGDEQVWAMNMKSRQERYHNWSACMKRDVMGTLKEQMQSLNSLQKRIDATFNESKCQFIREKRIVGCTTTAAAMYPALIKAASPDCILVEEAGEILEAHILTAMSDTTKQLILIGDHKQLRPKCNNYNLSVEKGDGYDLNRSLFERLILEGHPLVTLHTQHRMAPEISQFVRNMTYEGLKDSAKTEERPKPRGVRGRMIFVNHPHVETSATALQDRQDEGRKGSKENEFEANMVLKVVTYMSQQGCPEDKMVILTPYLGQLRLLREKLNKQREAVLSGLDQLELLRAGLADGIMATSGKRKPQIRLSTIDNYQGEESDIVIASLTRGNECGDIGFMKAPERLNVLISRARNCCIMIGNMTTFTASAAGAPTWGLFSKLLKEANCFYEGLPVQCDQHKEKEFLLTCAEDFDRHCPDGGCFERCNEIMGCGIHKCKQRCHRKTPTSHVLCKEIMDQTCDRQHSYQIPCYDQHVVGCGKCREEERIRRKRVERDLDLEKKRREEQARYKARLENLQDEIAHQKLKQKHLKEKEQEQNDLKNKAKELDSLNLLIATAEARKLVACAAKANSTESKKDNATQKTFAPGSPEEDWQYQKTTEMAKNDAIDQVMDMIGLEAVKQAFLHIKSRVDTALRQGASTESAKFGCSFLGNPGTGKTTVARLYAQLLTSMSVVSGTEFEEISGSSLANNGVQGCDAMIEGMLDKGGGVIFIDEAYQLSSGNSQGGKAVLDFLLTKVESLNGKISFIIAGYRKEMETFFEHNPGLLSRFPNTLRFEDYTDSELQRILMSKIDNDFNGRMKLEGGENGLYGRIVARRLGQCRGNEGFGNARAVQNMLDIIKTRQASRLHQERRAKLEPDDFLLTKTDLIGPEPSEALQRSEAWMKLQKLIGLDDVKDDLQSLMQSAKTNYDRELHEQNIVQYSLNRVFLGNPGTGKTTVAKLYGKILVDLGLLSNGEVVVKTPADFIGGALGQSEEKTKAILRTTRGKVLVIDEAYGLYGGNGVNDPYKTAVVDAIVAEVQSVPGDDRCVLLLGYRDQMEEMFLNVNAGLSRRFPLSTAFNFADFTRQELAKILDLKLSAQGYGATSPAKEVALDSLDRARSRRHFGNAGEIDILLNSAMSRHQKRLSAGETRRESTLEVLDMDPDANRLKRSSANIAKLFEGEIGSEHIVHLLQGYQKIVENAKKLGTDPKESIPFNFLFRGPPGTGKTSVARRIGQVFYDLGFLSSSEVLERSTSELVGQYVGQTGPKVLELLDKALGRVLLIDEAYRLNDGNFAKEALNELVDATTKLKYQNKLIIILAGYPQDINQLLSSNLGLTSRFPATIDFTGLSSTQCIELLAKKLVQKREQINKQGTGSLDVSQLESPRPEFVQALKGRFSLLSEQEGWANARDVIQLSDNIFQRIIQPELRADTNALSVTESAVTEELQRMIAERQSRSQTTRSPSDFIQKLPSPKFAPLQSLSSALNVEATTKTSTLTRAEVMRRKSGDEGDDEAASPSATCSTRDVGVSDAVWNRLQIDARKEEEKEKAYQAKRRILDEVASNDDEEEELRQQIIQELIDEDERRKKDQAAKQKLHEMGVCPMGFPWIRQRAGWRCAGGSHFVSEEAFRDTR